MMKGMIKIILGNRFIVTGVFIVFLTGYSTVGKADEYVVLEPEVEAYFIIADGLLRNGMEWEIRKKIFRPLKSIAGDYTEADRFGEAENIYQRMIVLSKKIYGNEHRETLKLLEKLSYLYSKSNQFVKRVVVGDEILTIRISIVGELHMSLVKEMKKQASAYRKMGAFTKAIETYKRILNIYIENEYTGGQYFSGYSKILYDLASAYIEMGDYAKAEPYFRQSISPAALSYKNINGLEMTKLFSYSNILQFVGKYKEAEDLSLNVLTYLSKQTGASSMQVAAVSSFLGNLYNQLGAYEKALTAKKRALRIFTTGFGEKSTFAAFGMNNLAETYLSMKDYKTALPLLKTATSILNVQIQSPTQFYVDKNFAMANLGLVYSRLKQYAKAEKIFINVLQDNIRNYPAYHPLIAYSKIILAETLVERKKYRQAAELSLDALSIANDKRSPLLIIRSYSVLAKIRAGQGRFSEAIFYAKQAVNTLQKIRSGLLNTEKSLQKAFVVSQADNYKILAGWLIDAGRLSEAEQVLAMLKEEEYFNFIRRAKVSDPRITRLPLGKLEYELQQKLASANSKRVGLGKKLNMLEKLTRQYLTVEQKEEIEDVKKKLVLAQAAYKRILLSVEAAFANKVSLSSQDLTNGAKEKDYKEFFTHAGKDIAVVHFLQLDDGLRIIVRTFNSDIAYKTAITKNVLHKTIWQLNKKLNRPDKNFKPDSKKLYQWLIKPVEAVLKKDGIKTLLVYKEGVLRYIPLSVLYNGKEFLIEKYAIGNYSSSPGANESNTKTWKVAGLGVSKQWGDFSPLPMVPFELDNIIKQNAQDATGVVNGQVYMNAAFTRKSLRMSLTSSYNIGHIATHYQFKPGTESDSFLLLGDGSHLNLGQIREEKYDFSNIELLTLSACETAVSERYSDGREIEGLATLVQRQGAKGVLASLWKVADCSTGELMRRFYKNRQQGMSKVAALQQSQLAFIQGKVPVLKVTKNLSQGCQPVSGLSQPNAPYRHPYYWAPFILMGSWQ